MAESPGGLPQRSCIRVRLAVRGQVQGVGFRPYVYRLAVRHGLGGVVANDGIGAIIEVEGAGHAVAAFEADLLAHLPPLAHVASVHKTRLDPLGVGEFRIDASREAQSHRPEVTPDAAICADCLRELFDEADRRFRYPFINCTNCGPRYSIIRGVPYDRAKTTMACFTMCGPCQREFDDPCDRRFHAQPNACDTCGPHVRLHLNARNDGCLAAAWSATVTHDADPIVAAVRLLKEGAILAVKGIGGYHLACRADREDVVRRLRQRKLRDGKPLAVMVPHVAAARRICRLSDADDAALSSPAAPIVLAPQRPGHDIAPAVAPGVSDFGVMLPYAPLHHLLFAEGLGPLVMTSANLASQPLTYRDEDALGALADVADAWLMHDRAIFRPIDDSVVFTFRGEPVPIRRARGFAPQPIVLAMPESIARRQGASARILAVGGELKSTVGLLDGRAFTLSEHLGDLANADAFRHFVAAIERLKTLCGFEPTAVACDLHPGYLSTGYAARQNLPVVAVQHHHAHIASVMAEWGARGPVVGLACDGTGYGTDGAVWGCEVLVCRGGAFERAGHLRYVPLVGGDVAAIETWRPAASLLHAAGVDWRRAIADLPEAPPADDLDVFERQLLTGLNAPPTSSLGRVFDAASCILGLCGRNRHEAEAAMALEAAARDVADALPLPYGLDDRDGRLELDLRETLRHLRERRLDGDDVPFLAAAFHETVAHLLAEAANRVATPRDVRTVALSGGCFANRRLLHRTLTLLESQGLQVLYHRRVPCGDGGLALGQAVVAAWRMASP